MRQLLASAIASIFLFAGVCEATAEPAAPLIWHLDDVGHVGGQATEILGHPSIAKEKTSSAIHFDGAADGIFVPANPLATLTEFTIEVFFKPEAGGLAEQRFFHIQDENESRVLLEIRLNNEGWALDSFLYSKKNESQRPLLDRSKLHPADRWTWVALTYANGHMIHYVDGAKELEGDVNFLPMVPGKMSLGVRQNKVFWFKGSIAEVRVHPRALHADELQHADPAAR